MKHLLLASAFSVAAACAAHATTINLTDSWAEGPITHQVGSASNDPTMVTTHQSTSNDGSVTPVSNPYTQTLTVGAATPTSNWLFVTIPGSAYGTTAADIAVNFTLSDGTGTGSFTAYMDYYADLGTDKDDMAWYGANPGSASYLTSAPTFTKNVTLTDGAVVAVTLPYETDWDMAQAITYQVIDGPTRVPEPASLALLGAGMVGLGFIRRRRAA